jgi:hypothetical protein
MDKQRRKVQWCCGLTREGWLDAIENDDDGKERTEVRPSVKK